MRILKLIVIISFFYIISNKAYANVSLPGFWNVGTGRTIIPIYNIDKKNSELISMESESIKIHLYRHFAVVKGEYYMKNHSSKDIKLNVGYPETGFFVNSKVDNVIFNEIEKLEISSNNKNLNFKIFKDNNDNKSWYVWETNFESNKLTKITVYYMVNTNNSRIKKAYDSEESNGFAYIVESGKIWKDNISSGTILIKLMEGLDLNDLYGILPENKLKYDKDNKVLIYSFNNLEPNENSNIIIRYVYNKDKIDFEKIKNNYKELYKLLDQKFEINDEKKLSFVNKDNFKVFPYTFVFIISFITGIVLIFLLFIFMIFKNIIKRKNKYN